VPNCETDFPGPLRIPPSGRIAVLNFQFQNKINIITVFTSVTKVKKFATKPPFYIFKPTQNINVGFALKSEVNKDISL